MSRQSVECEKCPIELNCEAKFIVFSDPEQCPLYMLMAKEGKCQ